jgi:hypothetical protein
VQPSSSVTRSSGGPQYSEDTLKFLSLETKSRKDSKSKWSKNSKSRLPDGDDDTDSITANSISAHAMKMMGLYTINLGTRAGQHLLTFHLILLPLIPICILLIQNTSTYITNNQSIRDLQDVTDQVSNAIDFARLTRMLQEERVSVALNYFVDERTNLTNLIDLDDFVQTDEREFIRGFSMANTFNNTDNALQIINYWPTDIAKVDYLKSKLRFQIKHALFRSKIKDREFELKEVFQWYNEINGNTLNYVTYSIHDSDISNFYRFIIGYKNLLRAVEFAGKAGILGMEYTTSGLDAEKFDKFLEFDILRREYINQTINFLPYIKEEYELLADRIGFDEIQDQIRKKERLSLATSDRDITVIVKYFFRSLKYSNKLRDMIQGIADNIIYYVDKDIKHLHSQNLMPLLFIIILLGFIPICVMFTLNITGSMVRNSRLYNMNVEEYQNEKSNTEKLRRSLLPAVIIQQMKCGETPRPEVFNNATIFFCNMVAFNGIASESTADQIIEFLNDLDSLFDERITSYDVYKVETIGDAYMVASGAPVPNGDQHAVQISKMALD